ncbi:MAG: glycosyltransferase family 39 protein [Candidatus Doudnabacteria bacterium]|nr:glycosyltransferase family 39 protein [Candidatus Doudnabacteria bacterium]
MNILKKYWPIIVITLIGLGFRLSHNIGISIWHDEAFSALMIRYGWGEMFQRLAMDVHPPMYYIALRIWHYAFGDGMWSLRGFSVLFGTLTIPAVYLFVKESFKNGKMALWAAGLAAINPFGLQFSTEARMYTFGAFFALMASYFLVKALREQKKVFDDDQLNMPNLPQDIRLKKELVWNYLGFVVCSTIIVLTHYYLLFTAAAIMLYGLIYCVRYYRKNYRQYLWLIASSLLVVVGFLPWLRQFLGQLRSVGGSYWIPDMTWWSIPSTLWTILLGFANDTTKSSTQLWLVILTLFSGYFFWRFVKKTDQFEKWLVILAVVMPFVGSVLFYLKSISCGHTGVNGSLVCHGRSLYQDRYFLFAAVFYTIAFSAFLSELKNRVWARVLLAGYILLNLVAIKNYWAELNLSAKPGMNGAARYLGTNVEPGQRVFLGTSFEFFNYKYYEQTYYHVPTPPLLYTGGRADVSKMSSVEGSALLSNSDLAPSYAQYAHSGDTEWVVWTYAFGGNPPDVPGTWNKISEKTFDDVRPYLGTTIYVDEYKVN